MNIGSPSSVSQSSADSQDSSGALQWLTPVATTAVSLSPLELHAMSLNDIDASGAPRLEIREEPIEKFRFRYKSEMLGTHGSIVGRNSEKYRKKTYPTVELVNYHGTAIVRCSLYTAELRPEKRSLHTHRLVVRQGSEDKDDPHDILVSPEVGYTAVFQGMGIIHTAKKHVVDELVKKKRCRLIEKYRAQNRDITILPTRDDCTIRAEAEAEAKRLNLNSVSLCFEAFEQDSAGNLLPLCEPVFSSSINNMKSALTGELKICRIDRHASSCVGGDEVFILVEKVGKKNIKIKFFEVDDEDNEVWCDYGRFSELDVHHQYAIVFRTPPYRNLDIETPVDVYIQLYRPTDGDCSEPIKFQYKPAERIAGRPTRKRQRSADTLSREMENNELNNYLSLSKLMPAAPDSVLTGGHDPILSSGSGEFEKLCNEPAEHPLNSAEFREYLSNLSFSGDLTAYLANVGHSEVHDMAMDIALDGEASKPSVKRNTGRKGKSHGEKGRIHGTAKKLPKVDEVDQTRPEAGEDSDGENHGMNKVTQKVVDVFGAMLKGKPLAREVTERIAGQLRKKSSEGIGPLHVAIATGNLDPFKIMLSTLHEDEQPTIINDQNENGDTLLHVAVAYSRPAHVAELLRQGANANILNSSQESVLHLAIRQDSLECLRQLLLQENYPIASNRPELDKLNDDGETALHVAARSNKLAAVELLVGAGASVNVQTQKQGNTALHIAVEQDNLQMVRFLVLEAKAEIDARNLAGNTPLHISCVVNDSGSVDICRFLMHNNADPYQANYIIEHQKQKQREEEGQAQGDPGPCPLELVAVKQEPLSDDELPPSPADDEDRRWTTQGQTSFDLASDKKEILDLLQRAEPPGARAESPSSLVVVKQEPQDRAPSPVHDDERKLLLDEETNEKICAILDSKGLWKKLAELLDCSFLVPCIESSKSPAATLFSYTGINGPAVSAHQLREHLASLGEEEGVLVIDEMFLIRRVKANLEKTS
ncbi:nuclear factor NF-kappa-B p100 subunit isoform X2 [Bacillus rossius redtenbacheri]